MSPAGDCVGRQGLQTYSPEKPTSVPGRPLQPAPAIREQRMTKDAQCSQARKHKTHGEAGDIVQATPCLEAAPEAAPPALPAPARAVEALQLSKAVSLTIGLGTQLVSV